MRWLRRVALGLSGLVAVTAVGGGVALACGAERGRFPVAWLQAR